MVARLWKAAIASARVADYRQHFDERVLPTLARTPGYLGAQVLAGTPPDPVELVVITWWTSLDAVRAFAGADVTHAVVDPEARAVLLHYDDRVTHYDVASDNRVTAGSRVSADS